MSRRKDALNLVENAQLVVHVVRVLGEAIEDAADGGGVEEGDGRVNQTVERVIVHLRITMGQVTRQDSAQLHATALRMLSHGHDSKSWDP